MLYKFILRIRNLSIYVVNYAINFVLLSFIYPKNINILTDRRNIKGVLNINYDTNIFISKGVCINSSPLYNPIGGDKVCTFVTKNNGSIHIGEDSGLSNCTIVSHDLIKLGKRVKIGGGVKIYDTDFHSLDCLNRAEQSSDIPKTAPVIIQDDVFIGTNSIILKGVNIGRGAIVGAASVVTKNIYPFEIWAGNPAKFIRKQDER